MPWVFPAAAAAESAWSKRGFRRRMLFTGVAGLAQQEAPVYVDRSRPLVGNHDQGGCWSHG